jgi:hypothetical protein
MSGYTHKVCGRPAIIIIGLRSVASGKGHISLKFTLSSLGLAF